MPILQNVRWERFCQAFVRGPTAGNAVASYRVAGFKSPDASPPYKLRKRPVVRARIDELLEKGAEIERRATERAAAKLAITRESVLEELAKIAFANMLDYVRPDDEGRV